MLLANTAIALLRPDPRCVSLGDFVPKVAPLFESIELLGVDLARMRLLEAISALGGLSKKRASQLERKWRDRPAASVQTQEP